ncbi:putative RNA-binding Zn ribbon-like protein [Actinoplanes lutulentus]|uniref:Putative stress-induced transcription regulator n=1 Tax=Actinoplanes lutulentus TaxID=1287878 RepID=A0A327Z5B1_9ACTN|nr:CGNR zinc finger domain-containing protein [Actinoplanes lutulentus]MBB2949095.1 putative RNA-binding Zn ribbon-like protein [Actinoplanes lutulentus]RAK31416.1 putative stress-induced transcription regulator [Actinoplanes lutulentus]
MLFAPDTEESLEFVVALVNTAPAASRSGTDELSTVDDLGTLLSGYTYSGRIDHDHAELEAVRDARTLLQKVWTLNRDDAVEAVNRMLREARALPYLTRHDGSDWHIHATEPTAPLAERIRVEAALALIDVIRTNETSRLRVCDADDCEGIFTDLSRNGSKRFCSVRCGNRVNMIAYRARKAPS